MQKAMSYDLFRRIVIQALSKPAFDFVDVHSFALAVIGDLIAVDFAKAEITRFRMGEVKAAYARSRPHRKRLRNLNSSIRFHVEQMPEWAFLSVIGARWISGGRTNAAIFF